MHWEEIDTQREDALSTKVNLPDRTSKLSDDTLEPMKLKGSNEGRLETQALCKATCASHVPEVSTCGSFAVT